MTGNISKLWTPPNAEIDMMRQQYGAPKTPTPATGNAYGHWAGRNLTYLNMPGGAAMMFDLSKLTLQDFRQMRDHYQVSVSLNLLTFMMHQLDWRIEGPNPKVNSFIEAEIREVWTQLIRGLCQAHWAGFSPMVVDWSNDGAHGRIGIERIKDMVPEDCYVNWKIEEGLAVDPGHVKPRFYEYDGIVQAAPGSHLGSIANGAIGRIPPENTVWYPLLMENGDYYGRKLLRPAFAPWFFSMLIHLFSNRYFERFGEPLAIGRADFEDEVQDSSGNFISGKEAMMNILQNVRNRGVVVLPSDKVPVGDGSRSEYAYDIEYLESQMRGVDFERYLTRLDEEISLSLFTPLLMMRVADVGSQSLGTTHVQAYLWMLNALAGDLKTYIDRYLVDRLREFNWGANAPEARFAYRSLGRDNAELLRTLVLETVRTGMARPDLHQLGEAVGLDFQEITNIIEAPGAQVPGVIPGQSAPGQPVVTPISGPTKAPQHDTRINRPERSVPKGIKNQVAARIESQIEKHRRVGGDFPADLGFKRQVAESLGCEQAQLDETYDRIAAWTVDTVASGLATEELMGYFDKVFEKQFEDFIVSFDSND